MSEVKKTSPMQYVSCLYYKWLCHIKVPASTQVIARLISDSFNKNKKSNLSSIDYDMLPLVSTTTCCL